MLSSSKLPPETEGFATGFDVLFPRATLAMRCPAHQCTLRLLELALNIQVQFADGLTCLTLVAPAINPQTLALYTPDLAQNVFPGVGDLVDLPPFVHLDPAYGGEKRA